MVKKTEPRLRELSSAESPSKDAGSCNLGFAILTIPAGAVPEFDSVRRLRLETSLRVLSAMRSVDICAYPYDLLSKLIHVEDERTSVWYIYRLACCAASASVQT